MTTLRFDPFRGFEQMLRKINEVAGEIERGVTVETGGYNPRIDIFEDNSSVYIVAEIAGIPKEKVNVKLTEDRILMISGTKERCEGEKDKTYLRSERNFGEFSRSFVLPENLDLSAVKANYRDGVLEITIAKKQPEPPKEIEIAIS
ncbi:MAG: Hsp20/alpha crystallin family protein [Ignavibacteria bacterium]|nr:Hsp20/alpha crystallin family protein [Ignavibacteria bacterium]